MGRADVEARIWAGTGVDAALRADVLDLGNVVLDNEQPRRRTRPAGHMGSVRIERLILHELDTVRGHKRLVDEEVELDEQSASYFAGHIAAAAKRADWRARFAGGANGVPALCDLLLAESADFVAASRALAERLYAQMATRRKQIAPGDFVVIVYSAEGEHEDDHRHIALLKLDPDRRLARQYDRHAGRTRVRIAAAENLLPDAARLQKCALIDMAPSCGEYRVTLLDTQAGPTSDGVAAFFYRGFLDAELEPSARRRTRIFLAASEAWLGQGRERLTPAETLAFYAARRRALAGERVALDAFAADALPDKPDLADDLARTLRDALFGEGAHAETDSFAVDRATADPVVQYVTLELDGGARLRVDAARFDELVRVAPDRRGGKVHLTVESLTLKEVGG